MIGLHLVANRLTGQTSRLDESLTRMRSLASTLEDIEAGVLVIDDDSRTIARSLLAAILGELGVLEDIRAQLVLVRYLLKIRPPGDLGPAA